MENPKEQLQAIKQNIEQASVYGKYIRAYTDQGQLGWFRICSKELPQLVKYGKCIFKLAPTEGLIQNPCYISIGEVKLLYHLYHSANEL